MNKKILFAFLMLPLMGISQKIPFTLHGKVAKLNAPALALIRYTEDGKVVTDSTVLKEGVFTFKGSISHPVKASLTLLHEGRTSVRSGNADALSIYLEEGIVKVSSLDSLKNATVAASSVNRESQLLKAALKESSDRANLLLNSFYALPKEKQQDKAINDSVSKLFTEIDKQQSEIKKAFILAHPDSWVSLETLKTVSGFYPDYNDVAPLYNALSNTLKQSFDGLAYAGKLDKIKLTAVGAVAPEFVQNDVKGNPVALSSFKGKYVLVDFWASWCGPCRAENPNVVKTYNEYKDKNFTVLGVSLDQPNGKEKWLKAIEDDHLTWTHVSDLQFWNNAAAKAYGIVAIPQNFLIDPSGKIVAKNLRAEGLKNKLSEYIK